MTGLLEVLEKTLTVAAFLLLGSRLRVNVAESSSLSICLGIVKVAFKHAISTFSDVVWKIAVCVLRLVSVGNIVTPSPIE